MAETKPITEQLPLMSVEAKENLAISLATDLALQQLQDGTASAQVIAHFLKLGSSKGRLENEKLSKENDVLDEKKKALQSSQRMEELYAEAIESMRSYGGS